MTQQVGIQINRGRGATPEELAHHAANKILTISDTAHPVIRDQAHAFRARLEKELLSLAKRAAYNDRSTVYNAIKDAGHPDLAQLIMRM